MSFVFINTVKKLQPKTVIMENVEGIMLGEAWKYVQQIYSDFKSAGYKVKHWLLKGEEMGVPQTRHRVFFIAVRNDVDFDLESLDMEFNYVPIRYKEIKEGAGEEINKNTILYHWLCKSNENDKRISDTIVRHGEKEKLFNHRICWNDNVMQTVASAGEIFRGDEKTRVSVEDIIHAQTFPEDYNFISKTYKDVVYICGMSVPPIMIKRIVTKLIERGLYK